MSKLGTLIKMDVDDEGKASGAFLGARVAIEITKPIKRGVLLRMDRNEEPRWFDVNYEKLPFYCFSCGLLGHSEVECNKPAPRNANGKQPYDLPLRAPEERRRKIQGFAEAASEFYNHGSSANSRTSCSSSDRQ